MTTAAGPKGTLLTGETTRYVLTPPNAPDAPTVTAAWFVATPPIVMLFAAIVPAVKPCASMRSEVGADPVKLNIVPPVWELWNATHGLTVYVVVAVKPEVAPVAVIVFDPPVVSATLVPPEKSTHEPYPSPIVALTLLPVVHAYALEAAVNAVVDPVTDSPEPKPVTVIAGETASPGKPKLLPVNVIATLAVTVYEAVAVVVPSDTEMVSAPPGRFGTFTEVWKLPRPEVVRHAEPAVVTTRLSVPLVPPLVVAQVPGVNHGTVEAPTAVVMVIALAGANPLPLMTRVDATCPDVEAVSTPLDNVDRDTVGPAACAVLNGSRKTIPAIPARNSSPIVPNEASLLFGVNCICILFTYFRNF